MDKRSDDTVADVKPALAGLPTGGSDVAKGTSGDMSITNAVQTMLTEMLNGIRKEFKSDIDSLKNLIKASPSFRGMLWVSLQGEDWE